MENQANAVTTAMVTMITSAANEAVTAISSIVPVATPMLVAGAVVYVGLKFWKKLRGGAS